MKLTRRNTLLTTAAALWGAPGFGWASGYPSKVVKMVVPYPAGSALELAARIF